MFATPLETTVVTFIKTLIDAIAESPIAHDPTLAFLAVVKVLILIARYASVPAAVLYVLLLWRRLVSNPGR